MLAFVYPLLAFIFVISCPFCSWGLGIGFCHPQLYHTWYLPVVGFFYFLWFALLVLFIACA